MRYQLDKKGSEWRWQVFDDHHGKTPGGYCALSFTQTNKGPNQCYVHEWPKNHPAPQNWIFCSL